MMTMDYGARLRQQIAESQNVKRQTEKSFGQDIAIIGMACRFPGANDLDEYWKVLSEGIDAVDEIPSERWDWREYYDEDPEAAHKMYNRWGGFIEGIDQFDPLFFKISPKEAELMDPQHRLFLEIAWRTLEHAGYAGNALAGSDTGVFAGCTNSHYSKRYQLAKQSEDYYLAALGNWNAALASRLSYFLDFHGPSLLIDTLCSSALSAVHAACNSLRRKECSVALAGGVNLILVPEHFIAGSKLKAHSPDGRCKSFDHRANGFTSGEGVGAVLLKPLSVALDDHDTIYGLVKGSAVNHDGRTNGIMAPNPKAQARVIGNALQDAKISADSITYIECHGTGTALGDPIEIEGLSQAFRMHTRENQYCAVGSVKSNIGHLEAAAGIAGLIKVLLAFQNKKIPASLHYEKANPHINFEKSPFFVNTSLSSWKSQGPRRAGISSFGLSGINAHLILEEQPNLTSVPSANNNVSLLPVSARSEDALMELLGRYRRHLEKHPEYSLADICWTASVGNAHHKHRIALITMTREEMWNLLNQCCLKGKQSGFYFPGVFHGVVAEADIINVHQVSNDGGTMQGRGLIEQAATNYVSGQAVNWRAINHGNTLRRIPLPPYPFEYVRCWAGEGEMEQKKPQSQKKLPCMISKHPLLGRRLGAVG